jgi:GxxExxY protein
LGAAVVEGERQLLISPQRRKGRKGKIDMIKKEDLFSKEIVGAAIEVHRNLGPGLLESAYEECLCREFAIRRFAFERQKPLPVSYKGVKLDCGYRVDVVVEKLVILELKAVDRIEPIHEAQLLTYLKLSGLKLGLLINFNVPILKNGIKRIVNNL